MCSHPVRIDVCFLVWSFVYFHNSCVRTAKALARLHGCAGLPEPLLLAYVISTKISWAGSFTGVHKRYTVAAKQTDLGKSRSQNSVSSQCACGKSSIARKPEDHPKIFKRLKTSKKCNPLDFKFYPRKPTNKIFPIWCNVKFSFLFWIV